MTTYDADFGSKLAETAELVLSIGTDALEAKRTVAYLSLLSAEISLKALLERAGFDPKEIRKRSHKLKDLLTDLCECKIEVEIVPGVVKLVPASRLCAVEVSYKGTETAVGRIVDAEADGASVYPNDVRYGENMRHFPPEVLAGMARAIVSFSKQHWPTIRK